MEKNTGNLVYNESEGGVKIISDYWETFHSKREGGALASVKFRYGSGRNILSAPLNSYIRKKEGPDYVYYDESRCTSPDISVTEENGNFTVTTAGKYVSGTGKQINVGYKRTVRYEKFGLVSVKLRMDFFEPVDWIIEVGTAGLGVAGTLNAVGYRPAAESDPGGTYTGHVGFCIWHEFGNGNHYTSNQKIGRYLPLYICMVNRRVEGLEIFRNDDTENDGRTFAAAEEGQSCCEIWHDADTDTIHLRYDAYGNFRSPITVDAGTYNFSYYMGLPFSKGAHKVHTPYFHAGIDNNWPDEKQLDIFAESGIRLIRLHNDYRADGHFWHDGCYPPYDSKNMKKMDRVIDQVHRRNMRIVPYFSLKELHPDCPEYQQYGERWKRTVDNKLSVIHNYAGNGEFGAQMCLRSGWLDFRKRSIDRVLSNHAFDGVYYDWTLATYCNNPSHMDGRKHTDMDEFLDLIFWTRERTGPDGLMFLHLSGTPMMVVENTANLVYTHEEFAALSPGPGDFCPEADFAGITEHQIVGWDRGETKKGKRFILSCFLEGLWTCARANPGNPALEMIKALTSYDIASLSFTPSSRQPVELDNKDIMASLYWKKGKALIHIANLGDTAGYCIFRVDLRQKGFSDGQKIRVRYPGRAKICSSVRELAVRGHRIRIAPLESRFVEISPSEKKQCAHRN